MAGVLEGRTAIVTGAASGVGLAVAQRFVEEGATVLMTDSDEAALQKEAELLAGEGPPVHVWSCDLNERLGIANLMASANDRLEQVDILVNASLTPIDGAFLDVDEAALDRSYRTNLRSVFLLCQAVARRMVEAREADPDLPRGAIVNVTSIAARRTAPELLPYSVSCAALDQLTRSMAVALGPRQIRVNGVALGAVMTSGLRTALREQDGLRDAMIEATPMGRIGESAEAAEAALFLASPRASFITGQILAVDGGRTMLDPLSMPQR
jgi:7-alpha-hydroxysteroid dehydrogenase